MILVVAVQWGKPSFSTYWVHLLSLKLALFASLELFVLFTRIPVPQLSVEQK